MPFATVYSTDFYHIEVDEAKSLLKATWQRPVNDDELKTGGTKLFEVIRDAKVERAVANAQALGALTAEAKEWMSTSFYELLSGTALKKLARVLPANLFHQLGLESVITRAEALGIIKYEAKNFTKPEDALHWALE